MKYTPITSILVLTVVVCTSVSAETEFEKFKKQQIEQSLSVKDEFEKYKIELLAAFSEYKNKTAKIWGDSNNIVPNKKNWVSYPDALSNRGVVDFEKGTIDVSVAIPIEENVSDSDARKKLEKTLLRTLTQGADTRTIIDISKNPVSQPKGESVLHGQIADKNGNNVTTDKLNQLVSDTSKNISKKTIKGTDGKSRVIYSVQLKLVPDHIKKRAEKYLLTVNKYADAQEIPSALIFAVIETESMFNPTARSAAPAFGLMQLVPTSGALDAYNYLYKKKKVVRDTYLYNPDNNIKLGAAYLHILYFIYLKEIKDPGSRMIASIAAYNTGSGNVFRAFSGKFTRVKFGNRGNWKKNALRKINNMTPMQVYNHMRQNLPYKEARSYIKTVNDRIGKYNVPDA